MANHGFITSKRTFKKEQVFKDLQEINERRFKGLLKIEDSDWGKNGSWFISYKDPDWEHPEGFNIWIRSPKKLEHRHSHCWAYYLEVIFSNELAKKYGTILSDEGHDEKWKPAPEKYPTFKVWLDFLYGHAKKKHPNSYKQMIDLEMEFCPKEFWDL